MSLPQLPFYLTPLIIQIFPSSTPLKGRICLCPSKFHTINRPQCNIRRSMCWGPPSSHPRAHYAAVSNPDQATRSGKTATRATPGATDEIYGPYDHGLAPKLTQAKGPGIPNAGKHEMWLYRTALAACKGEILHACRLALAQLQDPSPDLNGLIPDHWPPTNPSPNAHLCQDESGHCHTSQYVL